MSDSNEQQPIAQFPPSDVERVRALARLIERRIHELHTAEGSERFTTDHARELYVLEWLRDHWIGEALQ